MIDHPSGHKVTQLDPFAVRPAVGKVYALPSAEKYGASTQSVLAAIEYSEGEIENMVYAGAASFSWSKGYLPS